MSIKFKLIDAGYSDPRDYKEYSFDINFTDRNEFAEWAECDFYDDYDEFEYEMECGGEDYCGTLDFAGSYDNKGNYYVGYQSCEIQNYEKAIEKWKEFFKSHGKLI